MIEDNRKRHIICLTVIVLFMLSGFVQAQDGIIDLQFAQLPVADSGTAGTLYTVVKVQGTGGLRQDAVYLITHAGDREDLFQRQNQYAIDHPLINETWRFCSSYATTTDSTIIVGRNWDNQNVGSIIINLYQPRGGYTSISLSRAMDMGYPLNIDLAEIAGSELGDKLVLAPFYAVDGINEHGLAVTVAGLSTTTHENTGGRQPIFFTYLVRKILDQTKTVAEAVRLAEKYIPFDLDQHSTSGHLLITEVTGRSVILEYDQDQWRKIYPDKSWQVLTTKPIFNVPDSLLQAKCWRYRGISQTLEKTAGNINWQGGMQILRDVAQQGTTWSEVFCLPTKELYFSVYQNWDVIYHLNIP